MMWRPGLGGLRRLAQWRPGSHPGWKPGRWQLAGLLVLVTALVAGGLATRAAVTPDPLRVTARFDNTVGVYRGSDVRVLGVKVGRVLEVKPRGTRVDVVFEVDPEVAVARDTRAVVVAPTMVADRYVQLTMPVASGPRLADGAVIPQERTATPVEIDRLYESLDEVATVLGPEGANRDGALSELLGVAADNLRGNGGRSRALLTDLGRAARTLSETDDDAFAAIGHLEKLSRVLEANDEHVRGVSERAARVSRVLAEDRATIKSALRELAIALVEVQSFVHDNRAAMTKSVDRLSDATEVLAEQRRALGDLLDQLPPSVMAMLGAFDGSRGLLVGRADPNDVTLGDERPSGVEPRDRPTLPHPMPGGTP